MSLEELRLRALRRAARLLDERSLKRYFELRQHLLQKKSHRKEFEKAFMAFYKLNNARLGKPLLKKYFDLLFDADPGASGWPDFAPILKALKPRFQASFASKLVATRDESWPMFDRHVANFFGVKIPATGSEHYRTAVLTSHLSTIRKTYIAWANGALKEELERLRARIPDLATAHPVRLCDFLVWTAGRKNLTACLR